MNKRFLFSNSATAPSTTPRPHAKQEETLFPPRSFMLKPAMIVYHVASEVSCVWPPCLHVHVVTGRVMLAARAEQQTCDDELLPLVLGGEEKQRKPEAWLHESFIFFATPPPPLLLPSLSFFSLPPSLSHSRKPWVAEQVHLLCVKDAWDIKWVWE